MDVTDAGLDAAERAALEMAGRALSSIESAIASYEALREKPDGLRERIGRLRPFQKGLSEWMASAIRLGAKRTRAERVESLRRLRRILVGWG